MSSLGQQSASNPPASTHTFRVEGGGDHDFANPMKPPYESIEILGHGASGIVDKVRNTHTGSVYARKTICLRGSLEEMERMKATFDNETEIIRNLATHHHIVRVVRMYYQELKFCLILDPPADNGDLHTFIHLFRQQGTTYDRQKYETTVAILHRAFGCLASGLVFMHRRNVRHKDIKPGNILVHRGAVIYTDFGISLDFSQSGQSTTSGTAGPRTDRYAAPEIFEYGSRNTKSDVFSLGCVYFELLSALTSLAPVNSGTHYAKALDDIREGVLASSLSGSYSILARQALSMISSNKDERPSSYQVYEAMQNYSEYICDKCRQYASISPQPGSNARLGLSEETSYVSTTNPGPLLLPTSSKSHSRQGEPGDLHNSEQSRNPESNPPGPDKPEGTERADGTKHGHWIWSADYGDWYIYGKNKETNEIKYYWYKDLRQDNQ